VLAFGKFSPKKMTSIYRQYFILGGEFLHHGEEKEKKHQIFGHIVPSFFPQKIT
jgi:hypothetical protein